MHGFLLVIALLTVTLLIFGLYQLDQRVMRLEGKKRQMIAEKAAENMTSPPEPKRVTDNIFYGLEGEALFHAMSGEETQGLEFSDDARKRYELVLRKHILEVLEKAKNGDRAVESDAIIRTLRGPVRSWLPEYVLGSLIVQGGLLAKNPNDKRSINSLQSTIDELYLNLGYESSADLLSLDDAYALTDVTDTDIENVERKPGADGFM